jgi:hypothetical protein
MFGDNFIGCLGVHRRRTEQDSDQQQKLANGFHFILFLKYKCKSFYFSPAPILLIMKFWCYDEKK